jgi:hypothetical protein
MEHESLLRNHGSVDERTCVLDSVNITLSTPAFRSCAEYLHQVNLATRDSYSKVKEDYDLNGYVRYKTELPIHITFYQNQYRWLILRDVATYGH